MATLMPSRQPFASLDSPRLQQLASAKNRQNAITVSLNEKNTFTPSVKRRCPEPFEDDLDSENIDPSIFNSPSKRSKGFDGTPKKPSRYSLTTITTSARAASKPLSTSTFAPRLAISSPNTSTTTPISQSRGSPKHKRIGLLSRRKTAGGSPFTRVDPPSFGRKSTSSALPFSLDAALSGSISSYTPKQTVEAKASTLEESMPNSWFFEIHEDTPEQEATNLMEHSACVLDISSDDDCETKLRNDAKERGKENIPPPDFIASNLNVPTVTDGGIATSASAVQDTAAHVPAKMSAREKFAALDAMIEDRNPLSALPTADYYGPGLDAASYVIVDGTAPSKPSALSKEFEFEALLPESTADPVEQEKPEIPIFTDTTTEEPSAAVPVEAEAIQAPGVTTAIPLEETPAPKDDVLMQ